MNHGGPEKGRYRGVNNCCPEKDRYWWNIMCVNYPGGPEKGRYWWDIPYVKNPGGPEKGRYN